MNGDTWFVTFRDDRRGSWVRIEAPTEEHALAFIAHNYDPAEWDELLADVEFNPDLCPDGELAAFRVGFREEAPA